VVALKRGSIAVSVAKENDDNMSEITSKLQSSPDLEGMIA
jgi:hypothetical protein